MLYLPGTKIISEAAMWLLLRVYGLISRGLHPSVTFHGYDSVVIGGREITVSVEVKTKANSRKP